MGKDFEADTALPRLIRNAADFGKREFAGEDDPGKSHCGSPAHAPGIVDGHLGRGMERKSGYHLACQGGKTCILDEDRVRPDRVEPEQVVHGVSQFPVVDEGVDRDVDPDAMRMRFPDRVPDLVLGKVGGVFPGTEPFPAQVHRICPSRDGGPECFR